MIRYLNERTSEGLETIDEIDTKDFKTFSEYRKEKARLLAEYKLAHNNTNMYWSSRPTKAWRLGS